jgi:hypothetical protein
MLVRFASAPGRWGCASTSPTSRWPWTFRDLDLRANLASDAVLAALCLEHGLTMVSADSDFARFPDLTWFNPVQPG